MQSADHGERQWPLVIEDFIDAIKLADHRYQILRDKTGLFHSKLDGRDRIRSSDRIDRAFICFDEHQQNLEAVSFQRTRNGFVINVPGGGLQRLLIMFFSTDWFEFHLLLHVDRGRVNPVVFGVRAKELDVNCAKLVGDRDNQAVVIALDIEYHPVLTDQTGIAVLILDVLRRLPTRRARFLVPRLQWLLGAGMPCPVSDHVFFRYDAHKKNLCTAMGLMQAPSVDDGTRGSQRETVFCLLPA